MFGRRETWQNFLAKKPSVHQYVATVSFRAGEPRDIHCDAFQHTRNGILFVRADGSSTFIHEKMFAEIDIVASAPPAGSA